MMKKTNKGGAPNFNRDTAFIHGAYPTFISASARKTFFLPTQKIFPRHGAISLSGVILYYSSSGS